MESAALFASYHLYQGLPGVVWAFAVGLVFGTVFRATGRLGPLVVAHAASNFATL